MVEQLTCNQQVVGSNPTHGSHLDCCVPNVDVLKWTSRSTSVVIIVVLFFHVNSNLIYNIMTLITLPSGTVLAEVELDRQIVVKAITPTKDSNAN